MQSFKALWLNPTLCRCGHTAHHHHPFTNFTPCLASGCKCQHYSETERVATSCSIRHCQCIEPSCKECGVTH